MCSAKFGRLFLFVRESCFFNGIGSISLLFEACDVFVYDRTLTPLKVLFISWLKRALLHPLYGSGINYEVGHWFDTELGFKTVLWSTLVAFFSVFKSLWLEKF